MKILTGIKIKEADNYTIENESISSINLMERASNVIADWFGKNIDKETPLVFLIGKGNNGGDGLAVARILHKRGFICNVYIAFEKEQMTSECQINLQLLPKDVTSINLQEISPKTIIVDALLGTGVKGEIKEPLHSLIHSINLLQNTVISIDLPSGIRSEFDNADQQIIKADITLTLEFPKLAMLLPEAGEYCGHIEILAIGLSKDFITNTPTQYYYLTEDYVQSIKLNRSKFAHKGTYGHALLVCGSKGMTGAAILSTGAALRSGCGLATIHLPESERLAIHTSYPSAMTSLDPQPHFSEVPANLSKYNAIGIGCGLGKNTETITAFTELLSLIRTPIVIDADGLNILSENRDLLQLIPKNSILTPHPGELIRLIGEWKNEKEKLEKVYQLAKQLKSVVIVKGSHTMICSPDGNFYFNSTGNSGMAKGGSGDVLTGYITGLLARGYNSLHAAIIGVYIHGMAGDRAALKYGPEAINSQDMVDFLY